MQLPLQITFRGMEPSDAMDQRIRELAQRLERFSSQVVRCQVIVDAPHRHGQQGHLYEVHMQLTLPGDTIVVNREHRGLHSHEDVYVALRDAFRAARRQLEDYERERRLDVKHHDEEPAGWIAEIYPAEDFGRISTSDGRSIYFHRHSVVGENFDRLNTGTRVQFVEEIGDLGPQASTVKPLAHQGPSG
jgi:cold shock CspA family protein/ribosome-associated translation inhibitor RaiA